MAISKKNVQVKKNSAQTQETFQPATIELYDFGGKTLLDKEVVTLKNKERNFVDSVGRFIYKHKLNPNHLLERWYKKERQIHLIKTTGNSKTSGDCF